MIAKNPKSKNGIQGFTFVELMIVLAIIALIAGVANVSFSKLNGVQLVDKTTLSVMSVLNGAHSTAVSSKDASNFGVRIAKSNITSFEGTYGANNASYPISNLIGISTSTGINTDIIFQNLYGNTAASGTITIYLLSNPQTSSTIQIFSTGAIQRN